MADPEDSEDDDSLSLDLYRACDWSAPRSWLVLLGLGLATGTLCGLLGGMVTVHVFGRPAATINSELLAHIATMTTIVLVILSVFWATTVTVFALGDEPDTDPEWSARRIDFSRGYTILSILIAAILVPKLAIVSIFLDGKAPAASDAASWVFMVAVLAAIILGPTTIVAFLEHWCPPARTRTE